MAAALQVVETEVLDTAETSEEMEVVLGDEGEDFDDLDSMFAELQADAEAIAETPATTAEFTEEELVAAGTAVDIEELTQAAHAEMAELSEPESDESGLATGVVPGTAKRKAPVTKRISTGGMKKSEAITKALGTKLYDYLVLDVNDVTLPHEEIEAKVNAKLAEIDTLPIKIGEKLVNFYAHMVNGASLSNYTKIALDLLIKDGELTSKGLRDAYLARPYSIGTSNSQCTQLMKLLPTLGLVKREGGKLVVDPNSTLMPMLMPA